MSRAALALANLAAFAAASAGPASAAASREWPYVRPTRIQMQRWSDQRGYPQTGTGKRQGRARSASGAAFLR